MWRWEGGGGVNRERRLILALYILKSDPCPAGINEFAESTVSLQQTDIKP